MPPWSVYRHRQSLSRINDSLRFRHRPYAFDTSSVVPLRSSSCQPPDLVLPRPFPPVLTTMAFDHSRRRWFGTCSCKPVPRGLPSSVEQLRTTGPFGFSRSWHTIIGKPGVLDFHPPPLTSDFLRPFQHLVHLVEIEIAEQGRNHPALRNTLLPRRFQQQFEQPHNLGVVHSACHLLQYEGMSNRIEVGTQVEINDIGHVPHNCLRDALNRSVG